MGQAQKLLDDYWAEMTKGLSASQATFHARKLQDAFDQNYAKHGNEEQALQQATGGSRSLDRPWQAPPKPRVGASAPGGMGDKLAGAMSGLGDTFSKITSGAMGTTLAFGAMGGAIVGMAAAAGPAISGTLTKSMQLFAATVSQVAVGPILNLSFRLQDAAKWFDSLGDSTKNSIEKWITWGGAITGGALALGKVASVAGSLLPVFGALTGPVALLGAGLAMLAVKSPGALAPLASAGQQIVTALQPMVVQLGQLAQTMLPMLVSGAQAVAGVASVLAQGFGALTGALGSSGVQVIAMGAALLAWGGPARMVLTVGAAIAGAFGGMNSATKALVAGLGAVAVSTQLMGAAMVATPWGATIVSVGALVTALGAMTDWFGRGGTAAARMASQLLQVQANIDRIRGQGYIETKDLMGALTPEQQEAYKKAKTPEEKQAVIKEADKGVGQELGTMVDDSREKAVQASLGAAIKKASEAKGVLPGIPATVGKREDVFAETLNEEFQKRGLSDADKQKFGTQAKQGGLDEVLKGLFVKATTFGTVSPEDIAKAQATFALPKEQLEEKSAVLNKAQRGAIHDDSPEEIRLRQLQGLRSKYSTAAQREMQPTINQDYTAGFKQLLLANVSKDSLDKEILEAQRRTYSIMQDRIARALDSIDRKTPRPDPGPVN